MASEKIIAPFTPEQVQNLINWQRGPVHPFTCGGHDGCLRDEDVFEGVLIPYEGGWVCPCAKYKQDWAHAFMADPGPLARAKKVLDDIKAGKYKTPPPGDEGVGID